MGVVGELEPFVDGDIDLSICRGLVNHFGSTGKMASVEVNLIVVYSAEKGNLIPSCSISTVPPGLSTRWIS